jgi:hypothetical protein
MELAADRALVGLGLEEEAELDALLREDPAAGAEVAELEKAAAAVALAAVDVEAMSAKLSERVEAEAMQSLPTAIAPMNFDKTVQSPEGLRPKHLEKTAVIVEQAPPAPFRPKHLETTAPMPGAPQRPQPVQNTSNAPDGRGAWSAERPESRLGGVAGRSPLTDNVVQLEPRRASRVVAITGWIAAAACLALAIGAWRYRGRPEVAIVTPLAVERDKLLAKTGTTRLDWTATPDPAAKGASGDVVWNAIEQRGFMRFRGLAKNDPRGWQYQLWIFDKNREDKYPVDGGVFDVDAETGDVLVPIKARLPVGEPTLFAVTVEKPGGVVVSKRERIVVTAKLGG